MAINRTLFLKQYNHKSAQVKLGPTIIITGAHRLGVIVSKASLTNLHY